MTEAPASMQEVRLPRKRAKTLTLTIKSEIIHRLRNGESGANLAKCYGLSRTTIHNLKTRSDKILEYLNKSGDTERKTMKTAANRRLEKALYKWYLLQKGLGNMVTGPMIQEEALAINTRLEGSVKFKASSGWLQRFKIRHGIGTSHNNTTAQQPEETEESPFNLENQITNYPVLDSVIKYECVSMDDELENEQIYYCHRLVLNWRDFALQKPKDSELQTSIDESFLIYSCINSTGNHRLPLLVIGKEANPSPIILTGISYHSQSCGSLTQRVFKTWFKTAFTNEVKCFLSSQGFFERAKLLCTNWSLESCNELSADDGNISCHFLPVDNQNSTPPAIINLLKEAYQKTVLESIPKNLDLERFNKIYKQADALANLSLSWESLSQSQLIDPEYAEHRVKVEYEEQPDLVNGCSDDASSWPLVTCTTHNESTIFDEQAQNSTEEQIPSAEEAAKMIEKCITWLERQEDVKLKDVAVFKKIRNLAINKSRKKSSSKNKPKKS